MGARNPSYGVPCKDKDHRREIMIGNKHNANKFRTLEQRKIHSDKLRAFHKTEAGKRCIEKRTRKLRENRKLFGITGFKPNFNQSACKFFDYFNGACGWKGQHALNGGEYYIPDLGYWVDYYDIERNVVIEWDEKAHHFNNNQRVEQDIIRENRIKEFMGCKFIRIVETNTTDYEQTKNFILNIFAQ